MRLSNLPRAVVFDMDGLLLDSESLYRDSFIAASDEGGYGLPVELYQRVCGSPWPTITHTICAEQGENFPMERFRDAWLRHLAILQADGIGLKEGVIEILDLMDELGLPRAIATSSRHISVERHLGPHDIIRRFDHIVAREDYAEPKPSPLPYLTAAGRLGVQPSQCLALEDSYSGVRSAVSAGMMTVMVPDVAPATAEMERDCLAICRDLNAVAKLLRSTAAGRLKN